jgi:hypothetical protein
VALETDEPAAGQAESTDAQAVEAEAARLGRQHAHWLTMVSEDDLTARLVAVLRLGARFREAIAGLVSTRAMGEALEIHHLDWVRLAIETIAFDTEDAAREALLCVTEDGLSLRDVGALSRRSVAPAEVFVDEVLPSHRDRLLSADIGQVLGPLPVDGRFEVTAVVRRTVPTLDDERVVERARQTAIAQATRRAAREHVTRRFKA